MRNVKRQSLGLPAAASTRRKQNASCPAESRCMTKFLTPSARAPLRQVEFKFTRYGLNRVLTSDLLVSEIDGVQTVAERSSTVVRNGLWGSFRTLLQSWWRIDRIRTSPTTGRMLALHAGDRFLLLNQIWIVTSRDIKCCESSTGVRLGIRSETENQTAELICGTSDTISTRLQPAGLRIDGQIIPVWDEDFSLLPSMHG